MLRTTVALAALGVAGLATAPSPVLADAFAPSPALAGVPYAPGELLVKARPSHRFTTLAHRVGVRQTLAVVPGVGARLVRVNGDPRAVAARLARARGVRWAEPNWTMRAQAAPNDPLFGSLYGLARIGAPAAWAAQGLGGFPATGGVPVGIVDTGVDLAHEDLQGKVIACAGSTEGTVTEGECGDDNGHGTHVAGTIGALANNGVGVAGVAFSSPLVVCRALGGPDGSGTTADVAACVRWAHVQGAKVISMSLGGPASRTLAEACRAAFVRGGRAGSLLVAAAGNDGDGRDEFPAALDQVVSVAATGPDDAVAAFSNENADVEVAAPGVDILSTKLGGGYVRLSGTSMATPHVSAAAALLWDREPTATATTIRRRLDAAVDDLGAPGRDPAYGFGRLDLAKAGS